MIAILMKNIPDLKIGKMTLFDTILPAISVDFIVDPYRAPLSNININIHMNIHQSINIDLSINININIDIRAFRDGLI